MRLSHPWSGGRTSLTGSHSERINPYPWATGCAKASYRSTSEHHPFRMHRDLNRRANSDISFVDDSKRAYTWKGYTLGMSLEVGAHSLRSGDELFLIHLGLSSFMLQIPKTLSLSSTNVDACHRRDQTSHPPGLHLNSSWMHVHERSRTWSYSAFCSWRRRSEPGRGRLRMPQTVRRFCCLPVLGLDCRVDGNLVASSSCCWTRHSTVCQNSTAIP